MFTGIWQQFVADLGHTTWLEFVAVLSGIGSVWLSRIENIWVYPTGLLNTIIYIYLSFKSSLFGEASVNFYYTVVSIYGWILWARRNEQRRYVLQISFSSRRQWAQEFAFFGFFYALVYFALTYLKTGFAPLAIPWADAFASGTAYTGMWLMAKKKVESWYWWIATNIASIPLYFVKHYVVTSLYYVILLVLAVAGLAEWRRRVKTVAYAT
ncbi:MAG TPA: nicotinamide riboside transporter PnuC [Puia sp.]|nr:nicotinamide riboside transporter PnuC [Puia sp.]